MVQCSHWVGSDFLAKLVIFVAVDCPWRWLMVESGRLEKGEQTPLSSIRGVLLWKYCRDTTLLSMMPPKMRPKEQPISARWIVKTFTYSSMNLKKNTRGDILSNFFAPTHSHLKQHGMSQTYYFSKHALNDAHRFHRLQVL